jgi:mRNA-degrading endonuclease RelE of RelBE toxin-antitoxin system
MKWRLLLDIEAIDFLASLSRADEARLRQRLRQIQEAPDRFADYPERDEHGREVDVHLCGRFAIIYWSDHADLHLKVLKISPADS